MITFANVYLDTHFLP